MSVSSRRYLPAKHLDPPFRSSLWSFQAGKLLEFQPIVVHGTIYFMDKDGEFYALDARKGRVDWKRKVGLVVDSMVFLWLAFGSLDFLPGQIIGKAWMVLASIPLIALLRRRDERIGLRPA